MQLIIEVTRRCNLSCSHCLRGYSQQLDIDNKYITNILEQIKKNDINLSDVTFSGGEPTLNLSAINHFIAECKRLNITYGMFYIATNGNNLGIDFIHTCLELYAIAENKEYCQVSLSNDIQHDYIEDSELELIKGLKFFDKKHEDDNYDYYRHGGIREGNFLENYPENVGRTQSVYEFDDYTDWEDHTFYLNCKGSIIDGCDWSYDTQDNNKDVFVCNVKNFTKWFNKNVKPVMCSYA
jgi:hypothetical protein